MASWQLAPAYWVVTIASTTDMAVSAGSTKSAVSFVVVVPVAYFRKLSWGVLTGSV